MTRNALARTYRPRRFGEISTQEHVSETLRSAVARDRVAHAYLFSGPRGVGKTTAARVLAMALNCPNRGEDGEPCGECESCERIWAGRTSLDVVEIDAASNRGVDDARELRERAMYAPTEAGRFKVYIIDEAHMLTREAWNALLKILEEPPPRVIFVFATTEPQKIQQTAAPILSRTQRFDFRRLAVPVIVDRLAEVLAAESIEPDPEALLMIARRAEGGMRDALSLLDQALSFTDNRLTTDDVQRILGLVADEVYLELFGIIADARVAEVFRFVQDLVEGGHDLNEFYRGLADALRTLLIVRFDGADAAEVRDELRSRWSERAEAFSTGDLLRMLGQVAELDADGRFRKSSNPRVLIEALILRFAHLPRTVEIEELIRSVSGDDPAGPPPRPAPRPEPTAPLDAEPAPRPPAREPRAEKPGAADQGGDSESSTAAEAIRELLAEGNAGLPPGLGVFLRTAVRVEETADGVVIEMEAGPGSEKLQEPGARSAVQSALSTRLGRPIRLEVRIAGGSGDQPARLTPEQVRDQRLERLGRQEPALERAVKEWDLEMLD